MTTLPAARRSDYLLPAAGLLAAFLLRDLFNSLRILINNIFEQNVIFDMRRDVFARLQRLPVGYFDQRASGDLMTRVIEDVNSVERVLIDGTEQGTVASLSVVGGAGHFVLQEPDAGRHRLDSHSHSDGRRAVVHARPPTAATAPSAGPPAP